MTREKLLLALTKYLAVAQLEEEDSWLLCFVSKTRKMFIPLIKRAGIGSALIDPDQYDDAEYENLSELIESFPFSNKEKQILKLRYIENKSWDNIPDIVYLSKSRVMQLHKSCIDTLESLAF